MAGGGPAAGFGAGGAFAGGWSGFWPGRGYKPGTKGRGGVSMVSAGAGGRGRGGGGAGEGARWGVGDGYFNTPSRQKKVFFGSRSYLSRILGKISGYFASSSGIQNIISGFFGLPLTPITTKTGI